MRNWRLLAPIFGAVSAIGLVSSEVSASGICHNGISFNSSGQISDVQPFPGNGINIALSLQCGSGSPDVITLRGYGLASTNSDGTTRSVQANKSGGTGTITVEGVDGSGNVVCTVADSSANGMPSAFVSCPSNTFSFRVRGNF